MRYYDIRGNEMPCPFIKDFHKFVSTTHIVDQLAQSNVPLSCTGCRVIMQQQLPP